MAKAVEVAAPSMPKPRLYIDLQPSDFDLLQKFKLGETATFIVTGKVVGLEKRENEYDGEKKQRGCVDLEDYKVKSAPASEFTALSEDD